MVEEKDKSVDIPTEDVQQESEKEGGLSTSGLSTSGLSADEDTGSDNNEDNEQEEDSDQGTATSEKIDPPKDEYLEQVKNWRALREKADKAERERDELAKLLQQQNVPQQQQVNNDFTVGDDDLVEGKHLKQQQQTTNKRIWELEERLIEAHIKSKYPDFDEVVTPDTLGMLRDADPELAESLASNPNIQSKAIAAYKSIKRYGFARPQKYEQSKEKVNQNVSKPRTVTSISPQQADSPLSRVNAFAEGLTDSVKEQVWKEMQDIIKQS